MLVPLFVAAAAALPAVSAQAVTAATTLCETRYGVYQFTGTGGVPTYMRTLTSVSTNIFQVTTTTRPTITVTPSATTFTDVETVTTTTTTTVTSVPAATTIAAPPNWFPIYNPELSAPTPMPRIKRGSIEARGEHDIELRKRQTQTGNTAGYLVDRNGTSSNLNQTFPYRVVCTVQTIVNLTETTVVTGTADIVTLTPSTATAEITITTTVVDTVIQVQPTPTVHAACLSNNVVNHIRDIYNEDLYFDRVLWHQNGGLPVANALVIPVATGTDCCILCQETASCAGSFFVPSEGNCHLRLNQAAPLGIGSPAPSSSLLPPFPLSTVNATAFPTATGTGLRRRQALSTGVMEDGTMTAFATGMVGDVGPVATGVPVANTCPAGSMSTFLGTAYGSESFPEDLAIQFSNGPCGRLVMWMIPVEDFNTNDPTTPGQFKRI